MGCYGHEKIFFSLQTNIQYLVNEWGRCSWEAGYSMKVLKALEHHKSASDLHDFMHITVMRKEK